LKKLEARCQLLARTTRGRLILAALALLLGSLAAGLWLTRDCWQEFSLKDLTQGLPVLGGSQDKLLLLAQIENLHKEKAELLEKLDQLQGQLRQMAEENAGLRMEVEKKSQELRPNRCNRNTWPCLPADRRTKSCFKGSKAVRS